MSARVLIIDDDDIAREHLGSILREGGHAVHELPSPIGATMLIMRESIEVVVLDVFMPSMSGDKFAKLLRGNPRLSACAIVLVSSCPSRELHEVSEHVRADAVVSKEDAGRDLLPTVTRIAQRAANRVSKGSVPDRN